MTLFKILTQTCGLSLREAADFLNVRQDTVKSWSSGRNGTPPGVIDEMADLADQIDKAAKEEVFQLVKEHNTSDVIELFLAVDDKEAHTFGWPCIGAHAAMLGRVITIGMAQGYRFIMVSPSTDPEEE